MAQVPMAATKALLAYFGWILGTKTSSAWSLTLLPKNSGPFHPQGTLLSNNAAVNQRRRTLFSSTAATLGLLGCGTPSSAVVETVGKDPTCNDGTCLGVWDGLLADCPHGMAGKQGAGCTSSQDDTPGTFSEPWDYSESDSLDWQHQMRKLLPVIQAVSAKRGDSVRVLLQENRYLRVAFTDGRSGETSTGEFYFTPDDTTVQFRIASLESSSTSPFTPSLRNIERAELLRKEMRYLKLPVLRNRRRALFFVESEVDTFGPGSAALGPPAEMRTGELEGRQDIDSRKKLDFLQNFPIPL
jgi:hypothetical protein